MPALEQFLGIGAGLSAPMIHRLTELARRAEDLRQADLSKVDYVYLLA